MDPLPLDEKHPANVRLLASLKARADQRGKKLGPIARPDCVRDPYMNCGSHPDIVGRVWDELAAALPTNGRCLVFGTPALVHPRSGVVLAVCYGTAYCIRLPSKTAQVRGQAIQEWTGGGTTDLSTEFGPAWVFGRFWPGELEAIREVYREFNQPAEPV
jgi:hypothetical protein